jgi:hypothetical protein
MRAGTPSTAMIVVAPASRAPAVAQRPIVLGKHRDRVADATPPLSAPEKPVDMMSGHISTCSSVSASGTRARLAIASGTSTYSA